MKTKKMIAIIATIMIMTLMIAGNAFGEEPHTHSFSSTWVNVGTSGICMQLNSTCTVCGYIYVSAYDYTHTYSNICDNSCNECGYFRSATHSWDNGVWEEIGTQFTCKRLVETCTVCYATRITAYDYTHFYPYGEWNGCFDCGYTP